MHAGRLNGRGAPLAANLAEAVEIALAATATR